MTGVWRTEAIALTGLSGRRVQVEAAVSQQLPGMAIIGLADTALAEARLRVRTAAAQAGYPLPPRFVTVNLSPADLPKHGSGFDLAIAVAVLIATGACPGTRAPGTAYIGELGLDGELRRPSGLLSAVLAARDLGFARVMVPADAATEARLVPGLDLVPVSGLSEAVKWHQGHDVIQTPHTPSTTPDTNIASDMSEIVGQDEAVSALTIAAAGRHHLSMMGPPGSGKTLLASRLPTILPDLTPDESLIASSIASHEGNSLSSLITRPPFERPHHSTSKVALVGGGGPRGPRLGAITRASFGVLFLDEAPHFAQDALQALREPIEHGSIRIERTGFSAVLPAQAQIVMAANPCPCGKAGLPATALQCTCAPIQRTRYLQRISGPLSDRIDIRLTVRPVTSIQRASAANRPPSSAILRDRVAAARERAAHRLRGTPWHLSGDVDGDWLRGHDVQLPAHTTAVIDRALERHLISMRGYDRTLKIAWTIADLEEKARPDRDDVASALMFRGGDFE